MSGTVDLGVVHQGDASPTGTVTLSNQVLTSVAYQDNLDGTSDTLGSSNAQVSASGSLGVMSAGNSATITLTASTSSAVSLAGTLSVGNLVTPPTAPGLSSSNLATQTIAYTGGVFSGGGRWTGTGGATSWGSSGSNASWSDSNGSGVHAAPGVWGYSDTATFDGASTALTVSLSDATPNLAALNFSNSGYTLTGGSLTLNGGAGSGMITVLTGSSTLDSTVTLNFATSATLNASTGAQLEIDGPIAGSNPLTLTGDGTLVLGGASGFGGGVDVQSGTLQVSNAEAIADGSSLTVGDASAFASAPVVPALAISRSLAIAPVPEPGTLVLLVVGLACAAVYRRQRGLGS